MEKKPGKYEGKLPPLESRQILLNVNELEKGQYELILLQNGIPFKRVYFKKH
ncbi:hypothetical protein [Algoriphagus boritolerans]|uniref:Uncharacterized protein n=1 Tax=Algoriphagus boritolerans DSM 17298 = JCM 18970 TaxID=1120964 RepID=A0A1H5T517_9BACT|nr:hypothetical protein [Algoriphagus boritolerans]SEF57913.1 hypothetical protein SAMN03080598_00697 [Algoriphagus boritolerans DSM 17298 = JCM 18970]